MSKDPAFLFYSSDFLTGTHFMSNAQVGALIRLFCFQHQMGHLRKADIVKTCDEGDETSVLSKFQEDDNNLYFNTRLEKEVIKRAEFTASRKRNGSSPRKKATKMEIMDSICQACPQHKDDFMESLCSACAQHKDNHMEDENEDENDNDPKRNENVNENENENEKEDESEENEK